MISITDEQFKIVLDILNKFVPNCEVRAFGSRYKWTAKEYSDLDLAIVGKENLNKKLMIDLKEAFAESDLPFRVDVLDWNEISDDFRKVIEKGYEVIKEGAKDNKSEWKEVRLGEICTVKGGKRLPKGINLSKNKNSHPYIRVKDLNGKKNICLNDDFEYVDDKTQKSISRYIVNTNDLIISIVGTIGLVAKVDKSLNNANLTENCVKLTNLIYVNSDYLYYYLSSYKGQNEINKGTVGAVQLKLPIKNIQDIKVILPPIQEQKAIAETLSCLDDKIELNNRINKTLEEMAQAIFKSWFVDFEPFKDGEFEDSELGKIPKGWKVDSLDNIANITMGQSPSGSSFNENNNGMVFYQGRTDFGKRYPTIRLYTTEPKRKAEKDDVLLSVRAPVGDINVAKENCCIGRGLATLKSKSGCNSFLLYQLLNLKESFNIYNGEGTVFGSINKNTLNSMRVLIPLEKNIGDFQAIVGKIDQLIKNNFLQTERLENIRNLLLPKLISGEIRVPTYEKQ